MIPDILDQFDRGIGVLISVSYNGTAIFFTSFNRCRITVMPKRAV